MKPTKRWGILLNEVIMMAEEKAPMLSQIFSREEVSQQRLNQRIFTAKPWKTLSATFLEKGLGKSKPRKIIKKPGGVVITFISTNFLRSFSIKKQQATKPQRTRKKREKNAPEIRHPLKSN